MELRTQISFLAGLFAIAIGLGVLLRPRKSLLSWWFGAFSMAIAAWHWSATLASVFSPSPAFQRLYLVCGVLVPVAAVGFLRLFLEEDAQPVVRLWRAALSVGALLIVLVCSPLYAAPSVPPAIFAYMSLLLVLALRALWQRAHRVKSSFARRRLRFLVLIGALATLFTSADYLPLVGLEIPPVGTVLTLVFLYILSQAVLRERLLDLYELAARLSVLTALSFSLAGVFWLVRSVWGGQFFMHSVAAALVVLLVYDPVRLKVEQQISQLLFRERHDLEQAVGALRRRLQHVLELEHLPELLMAGLEGSQRVTHAALYLIDAEMRGYALHGQLGATPVRRLESAAVRPLIDALRSQHVLIIEGIEREREAHHAAKRDREAETCHEVVQCLEAMHASVCIALSVEQDIYGMLCVRDERVRDAFSPEEVQLLLGLCAQVVTAIENTRQYQRMKERDKLATMGEMSAGLAHEIRNPLGAIKASAEYLRETPPGDAGNDEFLRIIVEEVDRLNRVVSSFLDYASPAHGDLHMLCDVNAVVERTAQVLAAEVDEVDLMASLSLAADLPRVRIDAERLRQVLINLIQNALQAIEPGGSLRIETQRSEPGAGWVDISVSDTGMGVPQQVLHNLFEPFVTTRRTGTGLGLAICQRIVSAASGKIVVQTRQNQGSTFTVRLPAVSAEPQPGDASPESGALDTPTVSATNR